MMEENVRAILKQYRVSITKARIVMLDFFLQSNEALTQQYFLTNPSLLLDRTTVFRTLNLFVEKKIILRIPAADGINRYLVMQAKTSVHSNFICNGCKRIIPINMIVQPRVKLPKGFKFQNTEITIRGLCSSCRN
jgi:Fur family transcriptional regulator, ferric uptake regulator